VISVAAWVIALQALNRPGGQPPFESNSLVLLGVYAPALIMVLRRDNVGPLPAFIERRIARWPSWIRGAADDGSAA
jgi:hypothetical protein